MNKIINSTPILLISIFICLIIGGYDLLYSQNVSLIMVKLSGGLILVNAGYFFIDILDKYSNKSKNKTL
jgi:hypothetical protein